MLKISSYNINGIRAAHRKGILEWFDESNPDIICLQETRAEEHQIPQEILDLGYKKSYFNAEKKGYSGVSIFTKHKPVHIEYGMGIEWIDNEGRIIMNEFDEFKIYSVYVPSGTTGDKRQDLKMKFLDDFYAFGETVMNDEKPSIICGDFNICHTEIDIHNPKQNKNTSGFLIEEREWVSSFLELGFVDVFRSLHKDETDLYSWWSYRARSKEKNKGWRIDYHFAHPKVAQKAIEAKIEMEWDMSDHAPVTITYDI